MISFDLIELGLARLGCSPSLVGVKDVLHELFVLPEEVGQVVDEHGHELGREELEAQVGLHSHRRHCFGN